MQEIKEKKGKQVTQEVVSEDAIKRRIEFEDVEDEVDKFLFLNLRQTSDLNLLVFEKALEKTNHQFDFLEFYMAHVVR